MRNPSFGVLSFMEVKGLMGEYAIEQAIQIFTMCAKKLIKLEEIKSLI